eukprot:448394-Pyramimonas_sp.AAC.1
MHANMLALAQRCPCRTEPSGAKRLPKAWRRANLRVPHEKASTAAKLARSATPTTSRGGTGGSRIVRAAAATSSPG